MATTSPNRRPGDEKSLGFVSFGLTGNGGFQTVDKSDPATKDVTTTTEQSSAIDLGIPLQATASATVETGRFLNDDAPATSDAPGNIIDPTDTTGPSSTPFTSLDVEPTASSTWIDAGVTSIVSGTESNPSCAISASAEGEFLQDCKNTIVMSDHPHTLNRGTIAGIAITLIVVLVAVSILISYCWKRQIQSEKDLEKTSAWFKPNKKDRLNFIFQNGPMNDILAGKRRLSQQEHKKRGHLRNANVDVGPSHKKHSFMTEDVIRQSTLHDSPMEDPFYTPFDSPDIRESQIGIALTRYSTRQSKKSSISHNSKIVPSLPERVHQHQPTSNTQIGIARTESIKHKRVNSLTPQIVNITTPQRPQVATVRPRSRSLSPNTYGSPTVRRPHKAIHRAAVAARSGSPSKLARYYDIHTGQFLHPENTTYKPVTTHIGQNRSLTKSNTDPRLAELDNSSSSTYTARRRSETLTPLTLNPTPDFNSTSTARPTDCEISGEHVCAPATRYKCPYSAVQLNRIIAAVKRLDRERSEYEQGAMEREQGRLAAEEDQGEWARRWLQVMRERRLNDTGEKNAAAEIGEDVPVSKE